MTRPFVASQVYYRRYSDDILWICPTNNAATLKSKCEEALARQGKSTLTISPAKTTETEFCIKDAQLTCTGDVFSYLGFSFNAKKSLYRDKTISGYERDATFGIQSFVKKAYEKGAGSKDKKIKGNGKSLKQNLNIAQIYHKVGFPNKAYVFRQRESDEQAEGNFMTYHLRALKIFNGNKNASYQLSDQQLKNYKTFIQKQIIKEAKKYDASFAL